MNDPRITSYALGELTSRAREEFERDLAASDDLQHELHETLNLAKSLGHLPMPTDQLETEQRTHLLRQCADNQAATRRRNKVVRLWLPLSLAAAACLLLLPMVLPTQNSTSPEAPDFEGASAAADEKSDASALVAAVGQEAAKETRASAGLVVATAAPAEAPPVSETLALNAPLVVSAPAAPALRRAERSSEVAGSISTFTGGWGKGSASGGVARGRMESDSLARSVAPSDDFNTEAYNAIRENTFLAAQENPLSTFSIDVDTASYSNVRRFLRDGQMPPAGAIRTEEFINYFTYNYPQPVGAGPFSVNLEVSQSPWASGRGLVRIGIKGRDLPPTERGPANLVFLVDVSGSMNSPDKLPLLQRSLRGLVENLSAEDTVAIAVYAGSSGLVLPPTPGSKKSEIIAALDNLSAGGSTHGSEGIKLAYETARQNFRRGGLNRVILCTDGDFNVGVTDQSELTKLIERERASGVFLSVLGFGTGNLKDATMELLADKGNGNYAYIDTPAEGRKVLVEQMGATLFTIAKDVKIQVEFNPARVAAYRLIGYENRILAKEDFNDDKKDAGEIGAGHTVTALYEIIPAGQPVPGAPSVDALKYQTPAPVTDGRPGSGDLLTVKLRYKASDGDTSKLLEVPLAAENIPPFASASEDFRFAAAVAAFGLKLRQSPEAGNLSWDDIQKIARGALGADPGSHRAEFLTLIEQAKSLGLPAEDQ